MKNSTRELLKNKHLILIEQKRRRLLKSFKDFCFFVFEEIWQKKLVWNWHLESISKVLHKVVNGEIRYLIINIPPRYAKTTFVVILFCAWTTARDVRTKNLHLSYSKELALDNSSAIKEIIESPQYQELFPISLKDDTQAKGKWYTTKQGGMYATTADGQVTGFGAGLKGVDEYLGAIIYDDPVKPPLQPGESVDNAQIKAVNDRFVSTVLSRRNNTKFTPIICNMQRIDENDLCGFWKSGKANIKPNEIVELVLPAMNEDGPSEYDPRSPGEPLWDQEHTAEDLELMRSTIPGVYFSQYQQKPTPSKGLVFETEKILEYVDLPDDIQQIYTSWDTSFKDKETNDPTVGIVFGVRRTRYEDDYYILDVIRKRMLYPELKGKFKATDRKYKPLMNYVEDKASGQSLVPDLKKDGLKRVQEVKLIKGDKIARSVIAQSVVASSRLHIPKHASWKQDFLQELKMFPKGKHDDQVDALSLFCNKQQKAQRNLRLISLG